MDSLVGEALVNLFATLELESQGYSVEQIRYQREKILSQKKGFDEVTKAFRSGGLSQAYQKSKEFLKVDILQNPVSELNDLQQKSKIVFTFVYETSGPPHCMKFICTLYDGKRTVKSDPKLSKKDAKEDAARKYLN